MAESKHIANFLNKEEAEELFNLTYCNCKWVPIPFRKGDVLRSIDLNIDDEITGRILSLIPNFEIKGSYAEYYQDGTNYTPKHHLKHTRIILCLESVRVIKIGGKSVMVGLGSVVIVPSMVSLEVLQNKIPHPTMTITYFGDVKPPTDESKSVPLPPLPKET